MPPFCQVESLGGRTNAFEKTLKFYYLEEIVVKCGSVLVLYHNIQKDFSEYLFTNSVVTNY